MSVDIKKHIAVELAALCNMQPDEMEAFIEIPPQTDLGDYALPCFKLAKTMHKAPPVIATELAGGIAGKPVSYTHLTLPTN